MAFVFFFNAFCSGSIHFVVMLETIYYSFEGNDSYIKGSYKKEKDICSAKMRNWKGWRCFKSLTIYPFKSIFSKMNSNFRFKSQGHRNGLVSLYKDMESYGEYADIQVMWKMIESSSPNNNKKRTKIFATD